MHSGGGGTGGPRNGRPHPPSNDLPSVAPRPDVMHHADIPQHLLHLPDTAAHHLGHPDADRGAPDRTFPGHRAPKEGGQAVGGLGVQPEPGPIQHKGARDNNDFCELRSVVWGRRCVLHRRHYSDEGLL